MKRILCLLLILLLAASMAACQEDKPSFQSPVTVYYRTVAAENDLAESVIGSITLEGAPHKGNPQSLLNEYLKGTSEEGFSTTFPASTKVLGLSVTANSAKLQLNASLARLTGVDLSVACACIALTTMELTGVNTVRISASGTTLDGAEELVLNRDSLILLDLYNGQIP